MYCKHCKMEIITNVSDCPLCKKRLIDDNLKLESYPSLNKYHKTKKLAFKIIKFIFLVVCLVSGLINYLTFNDSYWSLIVIACLCTVLFFFKITFKPGFKIDKYIYYMSILISILLLVINYFTEYKFSWSINYVVPLIFSFGLLLLDVLSICSKKFFNRSIGKIFVLSIINIIFVIFDFVKWTHIVSFSLAIFTVLLFLVFDYDLIKQELIKRFHSR